MRGISFKLQTQISLRTNLFLVRVNLYGVSKLDKMKLQEKLKNRTQEKMPPG